MARTWLAALLALGCVGTLDGASDDPGAPAPGGTVAPRAPGRPGDPLTPPVTGGGTGGIGAVVVPPPPGAPAESAGPLPLRRLTRREYNNAVAALLGSGVGTPADAFPGDARNEAGFATPLAASTLDAQKYMEAAEALAAHATRNLTTLLPCDPKTGEDACARRFVESFARRAYRRALEATETAELYGVYENARKTLGIDFATSIGLVVQTVLQSPKFLYRWEVAPTARPAREGSLVKLTHHQVASRLAFLLWGAPPDEKLLDEADAGRLGTAAEVTAQARRMLAVEARAADAVADFHRQWLHLEGAAGLATLEKSKTAYPMFSDAVRAGMRAGLDAFVAGVFVGPQADGKLSTLLTAPVAYVRDTTAALYGLPEMTGATLVRKELDPTQRAGLLTQLGFLATHATPSGSHPTKRGNVIWQNVLCGPMGEIPAEVPMPKPPEPNVSTRERFEVHDSNQCASCHKLIDPLGFALEHYDGIGRFRAMDGGKPVNASGRAPLPGGESLTFGNGVEMVKKLAETADVRRCVTLQWFRYALGRGDGAGDAGSIERGLAQLGRAGDLRELLLSVVGSKTFLYRTPDEGEVF